MRLQLVAYPGVDEAFVVWTAPFITDCRGFSLRRRVRRTADSAPSPHAENAADADGFVEEVVSSWVGFANGPAVAEGARRPTTEWPLQKYFWSDYMVSIGDEVSYRVTPMVRAAGGVLVEDAAQASAWTAPIKLGPDCGGGVSCFFNRGVVASQWLARLLPQQGPVKALTTVIDSPGDRTRNFLAGPEREKIVAILQDAIANKRHVYAVLYELDDAELQGLLKALGKRAHVVLGNGSVKKKGADQNAEARLDISGACDVRDRLSSPRALAHNKFLVVCDPAGKPAAVWTGSMNWTRTGLCTQANNSLYIEDPALAAEYRKQWTALSKAGGDTPEILKDANARPRNVLHGTTLWFTPMRDQQDLLFVRERILAAQQGVLFLMFNPGPMGTLLNVIIERASPSGAAYDPDLYIQGVLNQDPSTKTTKVDLFHRGEHVEAFADRRTNPNADLVLPAAIDARLKYWVKELLKLPSAFAMVHSKVIVIDPFGARPVVVTGSHNMGPKASGTNDENFLIVEGNQRLAAVYASNIMAIYSQYRWRWRQNQQQASNPGAAWNGLQDDDRWQIDDRRTNLTAYDARRVRELDFWFGRR